MERSTDCYSTNNMPILCCNPKSSTDAVLISVPGENKETEKQSHEKKQQRQHQEDPSNYTMATTNMDEEHHEEESNHHQEEKANNSNDVLMPISHQEERTHRKSRFSSAVDISINHSINKVKNEEPFTADLELLQFYLKDLRREVVRAETDTPYNQAVWDHVVERLEFAKPTGFFSPSEKNSFQIKSAEDCGKVFMKCDEFRWLMPIFPNMIATKTGLSLQTVLTELLYATSIGLMELVWAAECTNCGAGTTREAFLSDLENEQVCEICHFENKTDMLDRVKVYFVWNPEVFYMPVSNYECPHDPGLPKLKNLIFIGLTFPTTNNSGFSFLFGEDDPLSQPMLPTGRNRIHCPFSGVDCYLDIAREATDSDKMIRLKLPASEMQKPHYGAPRKVFELEHGKARLDFLADTGSISCPFIYSDMPDDVFFPFPDDTLTRPEYTTAAEVVHTPCFRNLFGDQVVSESSRFSLKRVVLVFTDVVSSTNLYESAGDGAALDCVREHFKVLFSAFAEKGRIVKTVGDAVMGAFTTGEAAILAVAKALDKMISKKVMRNNDVPLEIRVGIHCGSALMVPLNGINDYFGSTVNIAARVESKAGNGECLVSEAVLAEPAAKAAYDKLLDSGYEHTRDVELSLKGVDGTVKASGFKSKLATSEDGK